MLPGFDGHEVCRRIQAERPVPVLMLTARDDEADVWSGSASAPTTTSPSRSGCGSWWPGSPRCSAGSTAPLSWPSRRPIEVGGLRVDPAARRVWRDEVEVRLTPTEFDLLACLAAEPGTVVTRERLLAEVWGWPGGSGTRTVDSHVKGLRAKIGADRVRTVHGVGYSLEAGRRDVSGQPLAPVGSLKVKLGLLVGASVVVASVVATLGRAGGVSAWLSIPVTILLALAVTQLLAVGMTSPLREMTAAARRMARGDYDVRVSETSHDEVGELARAFNRTARDLAAVDRQRRELVANVSHELRTPLTALQAVLENLVDGSGPPTRDALRPALAQAERLGDLVTDLLDLARVDAGKAPLTPEPVAIAPLLAEAVAEAGSTGRAGGVRRPRRAARPRRAGRPRPAAPAGRQPARQRISAQPGRRLGAGDRVPRRRAAPDRGRRPGAGRRPADRERAFERVRHPQPRPRAAAAPGSAWPSPAG